ncbi:putative minor pilin and initiator [Burkholderia lata]|uniref:Putative minor pilin and initiator n=2 Tax=Burkholderia lata (strain ATCC 17760 / DSM 23089 / LMG 22485 / NCIMB 9086 / R18194 / 383) TaxID=482957 RepID=A0A6P2SDF5_BURL3|nr:putative minor pilin and initiator [Burkholderia lata]
MQAPADRNDTVEVTLDRGAPPGEVVIFNKASGGYDTNAATKWGANSWTCQSATDAATGACATQPVWQPGGDSSEIRLSFKEQKTGVTTMLSLFGYVGVARHVDCSGNIIPEEPSPLSWRIPIHASETYVSSICANLVVFDERRLFVKILATELKKLPSGGIWKANLHLNLRQWISGSAGSPTIATFRAAITLNTTDKNNIQIYLPEFTAATPTVDLKLRRQSNGSRLSGLSNVDMCLYDGYNSQSTWFKVSASDGLSISQRDGGSYSVLLDSDKSGAYASRVDYNVSLTYAGKKIALSNGETVQLQGVNNSAGRSVSLPGISVPVICTPVPLTLETPEFQSVWKRPGKYSGNLRITFSPSSANL